MEKCLHKYATDIAVLAELQNIYMSFNWCSQCGAIRLKNNKEKWGKWIKPKSKI